MSESEKSGLRALRLFCFRVLSEPCEKADWGVSAGKLWNNSQSCCGPAVNHTVCEACPDIFVRAKVILLFLLKDTALKI